MISAIDSNARDDSRHTTYRPITTISSGYDSPAAAVLAREIGATESLTIATARPDMNDKFEDLDDSGAPVAEQLGLRVIEFARDSYLESESFPEAEFLASGLGGNDIIMSDAEQYLESTLLFTGFHGDKAWSRKGTGASDGQIIRGDTSGSSLHEFRLRVGFIHVPAPCLGARKQPTLTGISNASEMAPWALGTRYDRPIPRRMVESAGVSRDRFGQQKKAVGQPFNPAPATPLAYGRPLEAILSPASLADFKSFLASLDEGRMARVRRSFRWRYLLNSPVPRKVQRALIRRRILRGPIALIDKYRYAYPLTDHDYLFQWAITKIQDRYDAS